MYYIIKKRLSQLIKLAITTKIGQYFLIFLLFLFMKSKNILLSVFIQFFIFSKNQKGLLLFIFKHDTLLLMLIISNPLN